MTEKLKNSIEELYTTFQNYRSGPTMIGSPNYDNLETWNKSIFKKPLRELDENDLSRFTGKAITTWGTVNDYKHFLPRIFELTAELRTPYEIWIAFDKLTLADWKNWDKKEQEVIQEFMIALWESIVNDNSEKVELEFRNYFSAIAHFYPNFSEVLAIWAKSESKAAIKHLAEYLVNEQIMLFGKRKLSGFNDKSENVDEFIAWVLSDEILNKVQKKYFEFEAESIAESTSWAEQIITTERKRTTQSNMKSD